MFIQSQCVQVGEIILVEFKEADRARSLSIIKNQRIIKITAPNKKGAFEWDKINCFMYKNLRNRSRQGVLTVSFNEEIPGAGRHVMEMGLVDVNCWKLLKANLEGVNFVENAELAALPTKELGKIAAINANHRGKVKS